MKLLLLLLATLLLSTPARAELMGMVPGRSANLHNPATFSLETGANWYTDQLKWSAIRINFKPIRGAVAYIDYAKLRASNLPISGSRVANYSGTGFGGGLLFVVPDFFTAYDVAFKAAYHTSVVNEVALHNTIAVSQGKTGRDDGAGASVLKPSQWSAEFVLSPIDPLYENGLTWYSTLGYVSTIAYAEMLETDLSTIAFVNYEQKKGLAFGSGLVKPFFRGQLYAGFEWLAGDPLLGFGFRYVLK